MMNLFKRKIKVGSTVEILNLGRCQIESIRCQQHNRDIMTKAIVGMKFKVEYISEEGDIYLLDWTFSGDYIQGYTGLTSPAFKLSQLKLL